MMAANTSDIQAIYNAVITREKERQGPLAFLMLNHIQEKSSLFQRLQAGLMPLIVPPPLSHSYPWYSVIESGGEHTVLVENTDDSGALGNEIYINRSRWIVLEKHSDAAMTVTHSSWHELGFEWLLELKQLPACDAETIIYPHHNPTQGRATTISDLEAIANYFVDDTRKGLQAAIARERGAESLGDTEAKPNLRRRLLNKANDEALLSRREQGLPDQITDEEAKTLLDERLHQLLADVVLDNEGNIFFNEWRIRRVSPATITEDVYLSAQELLADHEK
jgi:hypothetical protein